MAKSRLSDALSDQIVPSPLGHRSVLSPSQTNIRSPKLRSTSAENVRVETEWSLMGLWAMALYALMEAGRHCTPQSRLSIAHMLRAFRRMLRDYRRPSQRGHRLRDAAIDHYQRKNKTSRDYSRKKQESPPGEPQIKLATPQQIRGPNKLSHSTRKRLTA